MGFTAQPIRYKIYPWIRGSSSTTPVNLPGPIELEIFQRLETGELNRNLFVEAENSIRDLLRYDSYRRFLKSNSYKWVEAQVGFQIDVYIIYVT